VLCFSDHTIEKLTRALPGEFETDSSDEEAVDEDDDMVGAEEAVIEGDGLLQLIHDIKDFANGCLDEDHKIFKKIIASRFPYSPKTAKDENYEKILKDFRRVVQYRQNHDTTLHNLKEITFWLPQHNQQYTLSQIWNEYVAYAAERFRECITPQPARGLFEGRLFQHMHFCMSYEILHYLHTLGSKYLPVEPIPAIKRVIADGAPKNHPRYKQAQHVAEVLRRAARVSALISYVPPFSFLSSP
jgi:hypothetical protein